MTTLPRRTVSETARGIVRIAVRSRLTVVDTVPFDIVAAAAAGSIVNESDE